MDKMQIAKEIFTLLKAQQLTYAECDEILYTVKEKCEEQVSHKYKEARETLIK